MTRHIYLMTLSLCLSKMELIKEIKARQIFDSRGNPTVEVDVITSSNHKGRAAVPSGASTGKKEAIELRDGGSDYMGKGVLNAVANINNIIAKKLIGFDIHDQSGIDALMIDLDGTNNKSKLGANSILGVSLACAKASSNVQKKFLYENIGVGNARELPVPMINIINGGSHSDAPIAFQEFMIMPVGADTFSHSLKIASEIFHNLKSILSLRNLSTAVGDEGGFAPKLSGTEDAIETILHSIEKSGYKPGIDVFLALDCASSEFYKDGLYDYSIFQPNNPLKLTSTEQSNYLDKLIDSYPIISIEDGMDENDWDGWKTSTVQSGAKCQLVGDDLFVTNEKILKNGIDNGVANSILVKVNQIGTLTETINAVKLAQKNNYSTVMSHRSGETEDCIIADLSVALNTRQIKTGSMSRSDRMAKYNQLLRIEERLGKNAVFPGKDAFSF